MRRWVTLGLLAGILGSTGCNGGVDKCDAPFEAWSDADGDGYGTGDPVSVCTLATGQADNPRDCDDSEPKRNPDALETCNAIDDNCNGQIDEELDGVVFYNDGDGDGFGARFPAQFGCESPGPGWVRNSDDCDDTEAGVHPNATEICNEGIDDDCNGLADDLDAALDPSSQRNLYRDLDADTYGRPGVALKQCGDRPGFVENNQDCDDSRAEVNPDAQEICNLLDDDCDNLIDDRDPTVDPATRRLMYQDLDGDRFGNGAIEIFACKATPGFASLNPNDCNDANPNINPGVQERLCDTIDNDCDAATTDDRDSDADGWSICAGDCNEADPLVHPAAAELPDDGVDQNCNNLEGCYVDNDRDMARTTTWSEVPSPRCSQWPAAPGFFPIDCDDNDPTVDVDIWWYDDLDLDGYGGGTPVVFQCQDPGGGLVRETPVLDCDESDPDHSPATPELCDNAIDEDCDELIDCDDPDCDRIQPCAPPCDPQREVLYDGRCYYLDGSTGQCDAGYVLAPQSILTTIAPMFAGKDYKNVASNNCCIWHADQAIELQDWGMQPRDCNVNGPFQGGPVLGGTGCTNALNMQQGQLTLCQTL